MTFSNKPNYRTAMSGLAILFSICSMLLFISCEDDVSTPPPIAGFSSEVNELEVTFTNTSTNATAYEWDFGDGNTSSDIDPAHSYVLAQVYQVQLIAIQGENRDTLEQSVNVALEGVTPTASFTSSVANEKDVTFTNTSINATSFSWDFGDGGTSTETSPSHTYNVSGTYDVVLTAINGDETNTATESITLTISPENEQLNTGFVIIGVNDEGTARFVSHFDAIPTGTVDLTQGTTFQSFFALSALDGAFYSVQTDGSSGFQKTIVNGNKAFIEDGTISVISGFQMRARNADIGVFHDRNNADIVQTFNPTTMAVTGSLDMSAANAAVPDDPVRYQQFIFRSDDEFFAPMRTEAGGNVDDMALPIVSISQGEVVDVAEFEGLGNVIYFNGTRRSVDESGNLYIWHAGNLSVPTVSGSILKIPAGTYDYDPTYNFEVPLVNNPQLTGFGSFMNGFNYWQNGMGFVLINESIDQSLLDFIASKGGIENFTDDDFTTALGILFNAPTGAFALVDLENEEVSKVSGLPAVSVFAAGASTYFMNGEVYFGIVTPTENSLYIYDEATNSASKVFDATGVSLDDIFILSEDF